MRRRVLHRFYGIANRNIFGKPSDQADGGDAEAGAEEDTGNS